MDCTELETGSHIKTKRMFYEHHGIYIGEGLVIHYAFDGIRWIQWRSFPVVNR